ncbi:hypothetical protein DVH24_002735 [Malus domestica]|uniref:Uncharacterized protein n=1 Tax=Malus domestica TaxID=3750 RepID=A0A498K5R8_MALDO|nr:hypothetical protein DVH24_002735 [Malus domestica]
MSSFRSSFLAIFILFMASHSSLALQSQPETQFSSISAALALLPGAPLSSSPTLSPDISPLFPSPGGVPLSPSESSLLTNLRIRARLTRRSMLLLNQTLLLSLNQARLLLLNQARLLLYQALP